MPDGKIAVVAGILAAGLIAACGSAAEGGAAAAPRTSSATADFVGTVTAILDTESDVFATFFGADRAELGTVAGMAAAAVEPEVATFQAALTEAQAAARDLEPPPTATLFFGSFLEHFDRFVGEAARIRAALQNADFVAAADRYVRLKRGAFERLEFLRDRLALIDPAQAGRVRRPAGADRTPFGV